MFVRRKANKTGSISVQVINKGNGLYRVAKSFCVGSTEAEVVRLEEKASQYIREKTGMNRSRFEYEDEIKLNNFVSTISNSQVQVIGPESIFGTLYDRIGYGSVNNVLFKHLVVTRLFNPGSKLKTIDYLFRYQGIAINISKIYRFLDNLCLRKDEEGLGEKIAAIGLKRQVEDITYAHTQQVLGGKIEVVFYDMTTLYFEASDEDDLRKTGFSKAGKHQCPQIFLGLLVGQGGNPIGYELLEGNIFEGNTFIPVLRRMEERFNLGKPVVIIKREILNLCLKDGDVAVINKTETTHLVISKTNKRAAKDAHNRKRGLERLTKRLNSGRLTKSNINNKRYNKYLKMEGEITISINLEKFDADTAWDGIKGYQTNTNLPAKEVIGNYKNLWLIERAFRMKKTDFSVRPIYHRLYNRIDAHICICFTAYSIMLELERLLIANKSTISLKRAQEITYNMYQIVYQLPNSRETKTQILKMDKEQQELYDIIMSS